MSKRKYKRFIRRLETEFTADGKNYRALSSDFSFSGMFIRTNHAFQPGTDIEMLVHLPDGNTTALKGIVKRSLKTFAVSLKNGMGIEITQNDANYVNFMKSFASGEAMPIRSQAGMVTGKGTATNERIEATPVKSGVNTVPEQRSAAKPHRTVATPGFIILQCPQCGAKNRVKSESLALSVKCGKCLTPLKVS
jgi:predicted Zn finger-like uncharacterized protein